MINNNRLASIVHLWLNCLPWNEYFSEKSAVQSLTVKLPVMELLSKENHRDYESLTNESLMLMLMLMVESLTKKSNRNS